MTAAELKIRRNKGLCYYCDEKYNPSHRCKTACFLLVGHEKIEELLQDVDSVENGITTEEGNQLSNLETTPKISLNALVGQFYHSTLRVSGKCAGKEVKILVYNDSNNNFVNVKVAKKLKLKQYPILGFKVITGIGTYLYCDKKCEGVDLKIQGHIFNVDLFVLEIKGSDIVLGIQWLIELGTIKTNYKDLTMQFSYQGDEVILQGESMLAPIPLKGKSLNKMMMADAVAGFYQLQSFGESYSQPLTSNSDSITAIINQFQEVFEEPNELPPTREVDHRIPIEPNAKPVSIKP